MRIVDIPKPITVTVPSREGAKELVTTFLKFLEDCCGMFEGFAKGPKQARQFDKIMLVIEACAPDASVIQFEDADFDILKDAVDKAVWVTPSVNRKYIPFYEAIEKSQKVAVAGKKE